MKKLRKIIKEEIKKILIENPDKIDQFGLNYYKPDARAFGWYKNKLYGRRDNKIHRYLFMKTDVDIDRSDLDYSGRLWLKSKIISFWEYPSKSKFKKLIGDLEKFYKIKMKDWKVEVVDSEDKYEVDKYWEDDKVKFISVQDYIGSQKQIGKELSHVKSPLSKKKKKAIPGVGAAKAVSGARPGELPVVTRFRQRRGLGDGVIKLRKIIKEEIRRLRNRNRIVK